jgi:hypothetical protein
MTCSFAKLSEAMRRQSCMADVREHIYKVQSISLKKQQPKQRLTLNYFLKKQFSFFLGNHINQILQKLAGCF